MAEKDGHLWFRDSSRPTNLTSVEAEVMRVVWDAPGPVTVRDVYERLRQQKKIAYTTVMSLMSKLALKGFLIQNRSAAAYVYSAAMPAEEVAGIMVDAIVDKVLDGAAAPVISRLLGPKRKLSRQQVEGIEQLLKKKR